MRSHPAIHTARRKCRRQGSVIRIGMKTLEQLHKRLRDLEAEIAETKQRLPAHSVKPPVMMDLLELEDEYDALMKQVDRMRNDARDRG